MTDQALSSLLDEREASDRLAAAGLTIATASPDYVRYKPGQSTVIGYRFEAVDGEQTRGYAIHCPDRDRISAIYHKALTLRPRRSALGPGLVRVDDHTVVYTFPNDARLRRLRWYVQPRKIKRSLDRMFGLVEDISAHRTRVEVLRYKPERRLVTKIDLSTRSRQTASVVLRYTTNRDAPGLAELARALRDNGVETPAPLAQTDGGRVGIDEFVPGEQLRTIIDRGLACPAATAHALQRFHSTTPPQGLAGRSVADEFGQAKRALAGLGELHPALIGPLLALERRLANTAPGSLGAERLIHGDLHPKNLLAEPTGRDRAVTFVDLERSAVGRPASDLGRLLGHAKALEIRDPDSAATAITFAEAVADHYRTEIPIANAELSWFTATALIDQAALVARHLEGDWRRSSTHLAAAASRELSSIASRPEYA